MKFFVKQKGKEDIISVSCFLNMIEKKVFMKVYMVF